MKICVIMSTYNGEKYIVEQLDSIFGQKVDGDISLFVRDDGSTDRTVEILEKYKADKKVDIDILKGKNCGPSGSFLEAVRKCPDADYYAFCDQDDVWKDGKLSKAVESIGKTTKPCLWFSNYDVTDDNLNATLPNAIKKPVTDDLVVLFYNNIPGCVMVFNHELMKQLRRVKIDQIRMHDIMALNIALICGKVMFCRKSYIKYRQHSGNAVGFGHKKIHIKKWIVQKMLLLKNKEPYSTAEYAREICRRFRQHMTTDQINEYRLIAKTDKSFICRLKVLNKYYTKQTLGRTSISIRCKILLGLM